VYSASYKPFFVICFKSQINPRHAFENLPQPQIEINGSPGQTLWIIAMASLIWYARLYIKIEFRTLLFSQTHLGRCLNLILARKDLS